MAKRANPWGKWSGPKPWRRWTRDEALRALRLEAKCLRRTPRDIDLRQRDRLCASLKTYRRHFGSLNAAVIAAGLVPNPRGRNTDWRKKFCHRGHPRTPDNLDRQGHCCRCAEHWRSRQGRGVLVPKKPRPEWVAIVEQRKKELQAHWGMT